MLLMLTWAAGSMDAISYLGLGHVFTAMMTGNTVLLALALGQGDAAAVLRSVLALGGFMAGVAVGARVVDVGDQRGEWPPSVIRALALEGGVLVVFIAIWNLAEAPLTARWVGVLIPLSGLAMGVQAATVQRLGVPGVATTYITGTITTLVSELAARRHRAPAAATREYRIALLAGVFLVYGLGAVAGAVLHAQSARLVTLLPVMAVTLVVVNAASRYRRRPTDRGGDPA